MDCFSRIEPVKNGFVKCRKFLVAIGDETRQAIIMALMGNSTGLRVGEITKNTHLSRHAVSHHLRILRDCGLVTLDKQGTKNFYSLNIGDSFRNLIELVDNIVRFKRETI